MANSKTMRGLDTRVPKDILRHIEKDLSKEPTIVCEWDKRRKCDSYYKEETMKALSEIAKMQKEIKKLVKHIEKLTEENERLKNEK